MLSFTYMKPYSFEEIFQKNPDGSLTPKRPLHINGVTFGYGIQFKKGVAFGGVDFFNFLGKKIAAEEIDGIINIKGFYNN